MTYTSNILVTGADGQLGSELRAIAYTYSQYNFFFTNRINLDITDHRFVKNFIKNNKINTIINCAAYTLVDRAASEPELANEINHLAVSNLAKLAKAYNIKLIHISTDYVFDGNSNVPYKETDETNPQSIYGKTKLDGELAIKIINPPNSIIIRTSWLYSKFGNNFVKKITSLSKVNNKIDVVSDQVGSPTSAADLAQVILTILPKIKNKKFEIYHYSNSGFCSWCDFALEIFRTKNIRTIINPVITSEFSTYVKRPNYSVLEKSKIKTCFDLEVPFWKDSLSFVLESIKI
jgi:dTDP-4-dehydrorhamnose reductase